jgi:hypothetical protein
MASIPPAYLQGILLLIPCHPGQSKFCFCDPRSHLIEREAVEMEQKIGKYPKSMCDWTPI